MVRYWGATQFVGIMLTRMQWYRVYRQMFPIMTTKSIAENIREEEDSTKETTKKSFGKVQKEVIDQLKQEFDLNLKHFPRTCFSGDGTFLEEDFYDNWRKGEGRNPLVSGFGILFLEAGSDIESRSIEDMRRNLDITDVMEKISKKYQVEDPKLWMIEFSE